MDAKLPTCQALNHACLSASFSGGVVVLVTNLHFRGARVFNAIVDELLNKGMRFASNVLLSGSSAGGLASILNCDKFRELFPASTRVKCFSDAGYFSHVKDLSGKYKFEEYYDMIVTLHCFYPQFAIPYVKTPVFILQTTYDTFQVQNILATPQADPKGLFTKCKEDINACSSAQIQRLQGQ
ncbi:hypothetical protein L2E82_50740 [Cichorium intybus]|nr:hypothetical protein L2E82_50740 [Cichorium intybus]